MMSREIERLTSAPRRLSAAGIPLVPYRLLREMAVEAGFPARQINQIWHYNVADSGVITDAVRIRSAAIRRAA